MGVWGWPPQVKLCSSAYVTTIFLALSTGSDQVTNEDVVMLEQFTILLYDHTSDMVRIDEARKHLFIKKGRAMDAEQPWYNILKELCTKVGIVGVSFY